MSTVENEIENVPEDNYEDLARVDGWVPQEEFHGNPDHWVDAETFVKRGREINPILRRNNERLVQKMSAMEREHKAQMEKINGTIKEFSKFAADAEERAYKRALDELKAQKKIALENDDSDLAVEIDDKIIDLKADQRSKKSTRSVEDIVADVPTNAPVLTPEEIQQFQGWNEKNSWYGPNGDPELTAIADSLGSIRSSRGMKGVELLEDVTREMKRRYPEKFGNQRRNDPNSVESGVGGGSKRSKAKTYENLPSDAKKACDEFLAMGMVKSKEDYVKLYDWGQE
jgi:hypothetical protein